ncbi:unnamed protein product [Alternaria alternata]
MDAAEDIMDANSDSDSPAKDLRVKCTVRSKSYATKKTMQDHRSTKHRANKPIHTCSVCGRICKDKHGLMRHEKTHNRAPEPKVKCSVCERTFSLVGALKNHKRTHHTDITLTVDCPVCKKIFPGEGDVLQHRQKAHVPNFALMADPLYEYVDCHFTFLSRDRMNNHLLFRSLSPASISPAQLAVHLGKKRKRSVNGIDDGIDYDEDKWLFFIYLKPQQVLDKIARILPALSSSSPAIALLMESILRTCQISATFARTSNSEVT